MQPSIIVPERRLILPPHLRRRQRPTMHATVARVIRNSGSGGGGFQAGNPNFVADFDFTADRLSSGSVKQAAFTGAGFAAVTDAQTNTYASTRGYIYTVSPSGIDGFVSRYGSSFPFPGRMCMFEAHPSDDLTDHQTHFSIRIEPWYPNAWWTYWIYVANDGSMLSTWDNNNKHWYPANDFPADEGEFAYLALLGRLGDEHRSPTHNLNDNTAPQTEQYFCLQAASFGGSNGTCTLNTGEEQPRNTLEQNLDYDKHVLPNTLMQVKFHVDVSQASGVYEAWLREYGESWTKVAEFDGDTANFSWTTPTATRSSIAACLFPESVNQNTDVGQEGDYDSYMAIGYLAVADSQNKLPRFADEP